jgi:subfamily B ATP-binding cassette protein HlyB/CyaB
VISGKKSNLDTGFQCLVTVARFLGFAADPKQLKHLYGDSESTNAITQVVLAGRYLGMKARSVALNWTKLTKCPLPAIAEMSSGNFLVIAKMDEERVLIQDPHQPSPGTLSKQEFIDSWSGNMILLTKRALMPESLREFNFGWFVDALKKYKGLFGEVLLASFFIQLFALITPLFFQVVIDKVLSHNSLTTLDVLAFGLIVLAFFDVMLNGLRTYLFSHTASRVDVLLGARLFDHLMRLPLPYFIARQVGTTVARVRELDTIRNFITGTALTLVIDIGFTFVFFAVLYLYSPVLTAIVAGSIPLYVILSIVITPVLRKRLNEKFQRGAQNQAFLVESVNGIETLKSMAVEPQMQRKWEDQLAGVVSSTFKADNLGNIAGQVSQFINKVVTALILWIGATAVINGELTVGQLIAFNMIAGRVSAPILRLVQLWQDFQQAGISMKRLGDILNVATEPGHNPNRTSLPALVGHVQFEHMSFRYQPDRPEVLRNIDLDVKPGEIIGIVGRSGSGKSTLAKLIQRLYVPEKGRILVDGVDLSQIDPMWLRRQVGVVLQDNFLFNRSVRDNIALGEPSASIETVTEAAKLAGAHEFILELAKGYDTEVGEQGRVLSGGQRQRIAIARALITDPRILIFDEATSALDYESERIIQDNMRSICAARTVFIIAHRLSAVRDANRIIVLEQGEMVEQGSHQELLDLRGRYSQLYAYQANDVKSVISVQGQTSSDPAKLGPRKFVLKKKGASEEPGGSGA